jgi:EmrB/QacA subfamily drug resistance transporter
VSPDRLDDLAMAPILTLHRDGNDGVQRRNDQQEVNGKPENQAGYEDNEIEQRRERLAIDQETNRRQQRCKNVDHPANIEFQRWTAKGSGGAETRIMRRDRLVPLIVAVALFMENLDSTVIATSLPAIAVDIGTSPLALKLAVTSYLLSLAVFIPMSGWTADRFGGRMVFRAAIAVFVVGSIGCAASTSLASLVIARIVQGMGGAMMTPVGRLVLIRSVDKRALIDAMAWVSMPALVGPVMGPPVGGFITTYASWHWIFLINVPMGLLGIGLATRYIEDVRIPSTDRFDPTGMLLAGAGLAGMAFGLSVAGLNYLPGPVVAGLVLGGACLFVAYLFHARRVPAPVLDFSLLRLPTFRASLLGGFLFRIGVGALPFLLPLLLQLGFKLDPFQSGLVTFSAAVGALTMKAAAATILKRFGFRRVLILNSLLSALFIAACAAFAPGVPFWAIVPVLLIGGFFRSLQFTSINAMAYAEVSPERMSRATSLAAVGQQLSISAGVALGAAVVELVFASKGLPMIGAHDFPPAFLILAAVSASSALVFVRLPPEAGAELAERGRAAPPAPRNDAAKT